VEGGPRGLGARRRSQALHNVQSYTAAPRQQDLDKLTELEAVARDASERVKQAVSVDPARLNKAMNDAGIPISPCGPNVSHRRGPF
jgi:hypothetical protein